MVTPTQVAEEIIRLAATVKPCFEAGDVTAGTEAPYSVLYGGSPTPLQRSLGGLADAHRATFRLMAISNNSRGCRTLAARLSNVIDGADLDGSLFTVEYVGDPLRDPSDPSASWWTSTIEIRFHT